MTPLQIDFIKSLDTKREDGTIQSILMAPDLQGMSFEKVLCHLLRNLKAEKDFLVRNNIMLSRELNSK